MSKAKRLADLTEHERLAYVALLQGGSRTNRASGVAWSFAKIFAQAAILGFALLALYSFGWIIGVATGG